MYTLVSTLVQQGQRRAEEGNGVKLDSLAMPTTTGGSAKIFTASSTRSPISCAITCARSSGLRG